MGEVRRRVYAERAPEPGDIIWENIYIRPMKRWLITFLIFLFCILLLIPCYFLLTFLYREKREYSNGNSRSGQGVITYFFELLLTTWVAGVNICIELYILIFTRFERQMTNSDKELSVLSKITLLKFLNTILIPILSNPDHHNWFESHGLVQEVTFIVLILNGGEILRIIFNWNFLYKLPLRWYYTRKGDRWELTQKQANFLYQNDSTDMSKTLGVILVFVLTILFFTPLIPGLTIFGIFGSIAIYWVLKYLIVRRKIIFK